MMKMLEAGGLPVLTDNIRTPDVNNPKGYYEFEKVKELDEDTEWLSEARGKAVKIVSALLFYLPNNYSYKIIFMLRKFEEILASQKQMLLNLGKSTEDVSDEVLLQVFNKHLLKTQNWLTQQPNMEVLYINYNEILRDPTKAVKEIETFLGLNLNYKKMIEVVDHSLHRQRI